MVLLAGRKAAFKGTPIAAMASGASGSMSGFQVLYAVIIVLMKKMGNEKGVQFSDQA